MISILIPTLGKSPWLIQTLESCSRAAKNLKVEILLVTPMVTEPDFQKLKLILKNHFSQEGRVLRVEKPGIVEALNWGLRNAQYEYVARIDDDDTMHDMRLTEQISFLERHPNVTAVGSFTRVVDGAGNFLYNQHFPISSEKIKKEIIFGNVISHPSVMYRKSVVVKQGGYKDTFMPAEDYELWARLSRNGDLANIPQYLTNYRLHRDQSTQTNVFKIQEVTKCIIYQQFDFDFGTEFEELAPNEIVRFIEDNLSLKVHPKSEAKIKPKNSRQLVSLANIALARSLCSNISQNKLKIFRHLLISFQVSPMFAVLTLLDRIVVHFWNSSMRFKGTAQ